MTNTKQMKGETSPAFFFSNFKSVWIDDTQIPTDGDMIPLFINTCLNSINSDLACLVCVTTFKLMEKTVNEFCKHICELDASGGFVSFSVKPKQESIICFSFNNPDELQVVDLKINGVNYSFLIDTGATCSSLSANFYEGPIT